jgi:hypothetical protein
VSYHFTSPDAVAKGHKRTSGCEYRKTVITLDDETFDEIRAGAIANKCSFAAQARMLIEVGLETLRLEEAA